MADQNFISQSRFVKLSPILPAPVGLFFEFFLSLLVLRPAIWSLISSMQQYWSRLLHIKISDLPRRVAPESSQESGQIFEAFGKCSQKFTASLVWPRHSITWISGVCLSTTFLSIREGKQAVRTYTIGIARAQHHCFITPAINYSCFIFKYFFDS